MSARALRHEFGDGADLARALAQAVAAVLRAACAERGHASLALSGGSTPRRFLEQLARCELDWSRLAVSLVDERWVAPDDARSNERLLRETLPGLTGARFVPLYRPVPTPEQALAEVDGEIARMGLPFDAIVLGMGLDGHTASLFPGGDWLAEALDPRGRARVVPMRAPAAGQARMTLTLPVLVAARHLFLHIEGQAKRAMFDALASAPSPAPLGAVLAARAEPVVVYWAP